MQKMPTFFRALMRGRLFRHPIHAMLVHFPSALIPTSVLFDVLSWWYTNKLLAIVAFYTLFLGLLGGIVAALFGAIDYFHLPSVHIGWKKASLHALLNIIWLMVFGVLFGIRTTQYPLIDIASAPELIISVFCVLGLIFSNYLGGELVFHHKIGTYNKH